MKDLLLVMAVIIVMSCSSSNSTLKIGNYTYKVKTERVNTGTLLNPPKGKFGVPGVLITKIVLPVLLFVVIWTYPTFFKLETIGVFYYPLSFGLIIALVNYGQNRFNYFLSILLSLLVSFLVFFLVIFGMQFIEYVWRFIFSDSIFLMSDLPPKETVFILSAFLSAPLLMFLGYKFLFKFKKSKVTLWVICIEVCIHMPQAYFFSNVNLSTDPNVVFRT